MIFSTEDMKKAFHPDELAFTRNYLAHVPPDKLVVLLMHIPLVVTDNKAALFALIEDRPHLFSISGHTHEQAHFYIDEKLGWKGKEPHHHYIAGAVSGSWWCGAPDALNIPDATMNDGSPNGYAVVEVTGNQYRLRWKSARYPADYQMNIYVPESVPRERLPNTEVLVNFFAGSDRCRVLMRMDGADAPTAMTQTAGTDPACEQMHRMNAARQEGIWGWDMDPPSITRHLWKAPLPASLTPGIHRIAIEVTDAFGQVFTENQIFWVVE